MNVQELVQQFRTIAEADSNIGTFSFDDLPTVNSNRQKTYPFVLLKTPQSIMTPFKQMDDEPLWENYTINFYVLKTWTTEDKKTVPLEQRYMECDNVANTFLQTFLQAGTNVYSLFGDKAVNKTRGHHQHVDQLVGVNYSFTLRVWDSLC